MLALKHRWRERGPLKPGEMQVDTPEWMKNRPEYKRHRLGRIIALCTTGPRIEDNQTRHNL
jgi:hypothetical protein